MCSTMTARTNSPSLSRPEGEEARSASSVNVLLTSFAGLGLPRTLSLPVRSNTTVSQILKTISSRLPDVDRPLIVTTTSNRQLLSSNHDTVASLLSSPQDDFLPLRLSVRMCGGKGGFGSQLRAAGGRMSSRKNRNQQNQNPNGSNRNLDGRRLRTIDEAKRLAEYLATKPEMDRKEKEERRKRWESVVDAAERREDEIKSGKAGAGQGRLDAEYMESKEMAEERTREAVIRAMKAGIPRTGSESSVTDNDAESEDEGQKESSESSDEAVVGQSGTGGKSLFGWDEEDDDSEDDEGEEHAAVESNYEGMGKGRAT